MTAKQVAFQKAAEMVCNTFYSKTALPIRQTLLLDMLTAYERLRGINKTVTPWARMRVVDGEAILLDRLEVDS